MMEYVRKEKLDRRKRYSLWHWKNGQRRCKGSGYQLGQIKTVGVYVIPCASQ